MKNTQKLWIIIVVLGLIFICLAIVFTVDFIPYRRQEADQAFQISTARAQTSTAQSVPTNTLVPTITQTEVQTATTETPPAQTGVFTISANVDTNCRLGPSTLYDIVGYLLANRQSEVHGRNVAQTWWYIENPGKSGAYCWVWGQTTNVQGDVSLLPVVNPPPPPERPEVAYSVSFSRASTCNGATTAMFEVVNLGSLPLESATIRIQNLANNVMSSGPISPNGPFTSSASDCPPGADSLLAGASGFVGSNFPGMTPGKSDYKATITLCAEESMSGHCVTTVSEFQHP
jgi:hypothetical protein